MTKVLTVQLIESPYRNMEINMSPEVLKERQEYLFNLFKQCRNKYEMADILGISCAQLCKIWKNLKMDDVIKNDLQQKLYKDCKTTRDIEKEYNCSHKIYQKMLGQYGIAATKTKRLLSQEDMIKELRAQGKTKVEMAEILGVSMDTLNRAMARLGISTLSKDYIQDMTRNELLALKQKYKTKAKIAEVTHMSKHTVYKLFKLFNI